jgi:hypothetical protein
MCEEMASGKGVIVRRPNAKELLKIREGKVSLQELKEYAEDRLDIIKSMFDNSNLPDDIDINEINDLLVTIRKIYSNEYNSARRTKNTAINLGAIS